MKNPDVLRNFVVLEGIDGSGTTTQLDMIEKRCLSEKLRYWTTCEPTVEPSGKLIRSVLSGKYPVKPGTLARFFVADRYEHIYGVEGIKSHLRNGELVVSDRYLFSSLAYQSVDCGFDEVFALNRAFPLPELLVYLEIPAEIGDARASQRDSREIFEYEDFQKRALGCYEEAFDRYADNGIRFLRIDGTEPRETVFENIWSCIEQLPIQKV